MVSQKRAVQNSKRAHKRAVATSANYPNVVALGHDPRTGEAFRLVVDPDQHGQPREVLLSDTDLAAGESKICALLRRAGMRVPWARPDQQNMLRHLESQAPTKTFLVASQLGWLPLNNVAVGRNVFVLVNKVVGDCATDVRIRLPNSFPTNKFQPAGQLKGWQKVIARLADGNHVSIFAICVAFVSPILPLLHSLNAGFQFVARSGAGKSLCLRIAGSVWGGSVSAYHESWLTTANNLDPIATTHSGIFLAIDETGLATNTSRPRESVVVDAIYRLAEGRAKGRLTDMAPLASWSLFYLSTSEKPLAQLAATARTTPAQGQLARLIDIILPTHPTKGVFQDLHGTGDLSAFAEQVVTDLAANGGTAGPAYVKKLVAWVIRDKAELCSWLHERVAFYEKTSKQAGLSLADVKVLRSFALVYAAGRLAAKLKIVDWDWRSIFSAVKYCHENAPSVEAKVVEADPVRQVHNYIIDNQANFIDVRKSSNLINRNDLRNAMGVIHHNGTNHKVFLFGKSIFIERVCANLSRETVIRALKQAGVLVSHSSGKLTVDRTVIGQRLRMVCIKGSILKR